MNRTRLADRTLPRYSKGEESMNMITHIVGGALAVLITLLSVNKASGRGDGIDLLGCLLYGVSMICLYTMSSVYHGLQPGTAKKVLQVLDHCTIYFLISGSYSAVLLTGLRPLYPTLSWCIFGLEWILTTLAATLTAIDLKKYRVFSMTCYIVMGWAIIPFAPQVIRALSPAGFGFLLSGGIAYTIGAVLYGLGKTKKWMHSVFHLFVLFGSILQFISIYFFGL